MNQGPEQGACVLLDLLLGVNFLTILVERDRELAREVQAGGCRVCEGRLHVANYPRKEYGPTVPGLALACLRLSFCCGDCRKRHTSPSVRFCGRRVYLEIVFVLACLTQTTVEAVADPVVAAPDEEPTGPPSPSVAPSSSVLPAAAAAPSSSPSMASTFGVSGRTLTRWRKWWREEFPTSRVWRELQARLIPPVESASLPGGLLLRLAGTLEQRVLRLLELLLPLSVHGPPLGRAR